MEAPAQEFADETTIASVVMLLFFSVGLTIFMYFFRTIGDLPRRPVDFGLQQTSMVKVCNPFVLELNENTKDLKDILRFDLSVLCPCRVVIVWGPMIQALHHFILIPGRDVRTRILTNVEETELDPLHWDVLQFEAEGKHSIAVPCPDSVTSEALGEMPRSRYPVAAFVFTPEERVRDRTHEPDDGLEGTRSEDSTHDDEDSKDNSIVGLIAILHLKDAIVTKTSHIIAKYVKTAGIPIYSLQPLFVSQETTSGRENDSQSQETTSGRENDSQSQETTSGRENAKPSTSSDLRQRRTSNHLTSQDSDRGSPLNRKEPTPSCETLRSSVYSKPHEMIPPVKDETFGCTGSGSRHNSCMYQNGCRSCCKDFELKSQKDVINGDLTEGNEECGENLGVGGQGREDEGNDQRVDNNIGNSHSGHPDSLDNTPNVFKPLAQCIVCQSAPAKCALLPCRHNCVCLSCLRLLDKCPLCRGAMESYFIVSSGLGEDVDYDDYDTDGGEEEDALMEEMQRQGVAAHVENFFERVNHMVGFT